MLKAEKINRLSLTGGIILTALVTAGCSSNDSSIADTESEATSASDTGEGTTLGTDTDNTDVSGTAGSEACEAIAASFQTNGSANANLPDPEVNAVCDGDSVVITSNQIPDFPYIETSPGSPNAFDIEFVIPAVPTMAADVSDVPALGALGVAINGIPIFGATEGTGGDVMSLSGGFTECGGHNGPTGYHYHTFDVTGSDVCLFSEAEATAEPQLFGYALDGYPIFSGNFQFNSSWSLTDASLFASDTFSAHTYTEGSGDLDQCNGRTDDNGNYAYYTTETFPYTLGCYRGTVETTTQVQDMPAGPMGPPPGG